MAERSEFPVYFDGNHDNAKPDVVLGVWPGCTLDSGLGMVEDGEYPPTEDGVVVPPPEWEHLPRQPSSGFLGLRTGGANYYPIVDSNTAAVAAAGLLTELFVHEIMEWLAVDGRRVFEPHSPDDSHWTPIGQKLTEFWEYVLEHNPNTEPEDE